MGLRFESNYQRYTGVAATLADTDPLIRWIRIHEWTVDPGYQANLLMVLLSVEGQFPPPATADIGWMRLLANLETDGCEWERKFECKFVQCALTAKAFTPRLVILPMGSGIVFYAGQGLLSQALPVVTTVYRWWSCFVMDSQEAT